MIQPIRPRPDLTPEDRTFLDQTFEELAEAEQQLAPIRRALHLIADIRERLAERFGVEPLAACEECACQLYVGDLGYHDPEACIYWCAEHAPTWQDALNYNAESLEGEEGLDDGPDEAEERASRQAMVDAHLAGGGALTDKIVSPL